MEKNTHKRLNKLQNQVATVATGVYVAYARMERVKPVQLPADGFKGCPSLRNRLNRNVQKLNRLMEETMDVADELTEKLLDAEIKG